MRLKEISLGAVLALLAVFCREACINDKALAEAEARLASIPEPIVIDHRPVAEEAIDDIIKKYQEEPVIENLEVEGNAMKAPYRFLPLNDEYQVYMEELCDDMEINFFLAASLMFSESSFNPDAVGDSGRSVGLFQINKCWWKYFETRGINVHEPLGNIEAGLMILQDLIDKYPDDISAVIQCYKCGESRGQELLEEGIELNCIEPIVNQAMDWQMTVKEEP